MFRFDFQHVKVETQWRQRDSMIIDLMGTDGERQGRSTIAQR